MKRKKDSVSPPSSLFSGLKDETRHWILSVVSFSIALFFVLIAFDKAGIVGTYAHKILASLFGIGYLLFPLIFFIGGIVFLKEERPFFLTTTLIGALFFFLSGLGTIETVRPETGGMIGKALSVPLVTLFDVYATTILLVAIALISLLVMLDATPSKMLRGFFAWAREKARLGKGADMEEIQIQSGVSEPADDIHENEPAPDADDDAEEPSAEKKPVRAEKKSAPREEKAGERGVFSFASLFRTHGKEYTSPPLSLLETDRGKPGVGDVKANVNIIKRTLQNFGIDVEMDEVSIGPSVTRYALKPAQGVKLSRIVGLQNDLSLALAAHPIRIEAPIPGKSLVGIEIPHSKKTTVGLGSLISVPELATTEMPLAFPIGRSITGHPIVGNLSKMPHLLIAGATGSGKSVTIHTIITSLLYRNPPSRLCFIMVDPKRVELTLYNSIPHLLTPVITDPKKAILALKWAGKEMDRRYDILERESVRDIASYNKNIYEPAHAAAEAKKGSGDDEDETQEKPELPEAMPYIVIIIDELADIMSSYPRELESAIVRIAQMSRAVGIHLILSTQRPQVNIITGLIKANVPARIALQVASQTDSRTILDMGGAEKLLGSGDMLYLSPEMAKPVRLQSAFIGESEIKKVVGFLSRQTYEDGPLSLNLAGEGEKNALFDSALETEEDDELYEEARETVIRAGKASTTFLQRKLKIGYARAARIMDILEEKGVVGPGEGAKQREVLIRNDDEGYGREDDADTDDKNSVS